MGLRSWWFLYAVWVVALSGFLLSLYFGEVQHFEPCRLCWYQRMALFPIVLILGISVYKSDPGGLVYALPFSLLGFVFATYHLLQETFPLLQTSALCGEKGDCSEQFFLFFDFLTFPMLSAAGFLFISLSLLALRFSKRASWMHR